jgi:hypothetical protein
MDWSLKIQLKEAFYEIQSSEGSFDWCSGRNVLFGRFSIFVRANKSYQEYPIE